MGMHPAATLFYGVAFDEDAELPDWLTDAYDDGRDIEEVIEDRLLAALGFDVLASYSVRAEALRKIGVEFGQATNFADPYDGTTFYLSAHTAASCSYGPVKVGRSVLDISYTNANAELDWALEVLELTKPASGYGWHLAASYR